MPEEGLETAELREQMEEAKEHGAHGAHGAPAGGKSWTLYLSLSTAIIAVFAAISSLQSGANESHALLEKNEAVLIQAQASNKWAYYQAKSTKGALYEAQIAGLDEAKTDVAARLKAKVTKYDEEKAEINKEATKLDEEVVAKGKESEEFLHKHHRFAYAVTVFQISIALSAIAALTKTKPMWLLSLVTSLGGVAFAAMGFLGK
ncbi:MAG: DUF4337 domain-containing protein [Polyangiales bacterium]